MPSRSMNARVVVVTGATAGVGRAVARRFAQAGASLGLIARDAAALQEVEREVAALGGRAFAAPADVADADAVLAAAERIEATLGPVDVWVNDAMATVFSRFADMSPDEFRRVTEVTYLGYVHGTMAALRHMRPRGRGVVVQVGSALAYRGIPLQSAYCGAKHAIRGFTDAVRSELLHEKSGVRLVMVQLPAMNTPQFAWARTHMRRQPRPMGAVYQPEAAAEAVFTAARNRWREYWFGRTTFLTIIADTVLPGLLDRMLAHTAIEGQETAEPVRSDRKDNLYRPVSGLHRAHGTFGALAREHGLLVPGPVARLGVVALGALAFLALGLAVRPRLPAGPKLLARERV